MPVQLYRIDDRLIHGQVVVGWGQPLNIRLIVLVDDDVACCDWEQDLYRMGVPPEMELKFADVATTSPACNPFSTTKPSSVCVPTSTSRGSKFPCPRETKTTCLVPACRTAEAGTNSCRPRGALSRTFTNIPGFSNRLGFGILKRTLSVRVVGSI